MMIWMDIGDAGAELVWGGWRRYRLAVPLWFCLADVLQCDVMNHNLLSKYLTLLSIYIFENE